MKRTMLTLFRSHILCAFLALAPLLASADHSKPYTREPLPEELDVYRVLFESQFKEQHRVFGVCDVTIYGNENRALQNTGTPTPSIPGIPSGLIEELVAVNRPIPAPASEAPAKSFHEEGTLMWWYTKCPALFPRVVFESRMPVHGKFGPVITLSRVAFDRTRTTALVYSWVDGKHGEDQFVTMLTKDKSRVWKIGRMHKWF